MSDLDQLDIMRRAITALGLGQVAPEDLVASARASAAAREDARRLLSDANVRIKDLESALRDIGVNPGGDLPGEVRAIHNRTAANEAAAQHDLDCALRERDAAKAKIASNVAEAAARDMRIAELEQAIEGAHMVLDVAGVTWSLGNDSTRLPLIKRCSLALVGNDLAAKDDARSDAIRMAHAAAKISSDLAAAEITAALDDAGAPKVYNLEDDTERDIPDHERIRLLGERVHTLRAQVREAADATNYLDALIEAHNALDAIGAPRLADGCVLSLAARIRASAR